MLRDQYHSQLNQLRKIINSWDLMPGSPSNGFDSLANKLLSHLSKGADQTKVRNIISSDLVTRYGFFNDEIDADFFIDEVLDWWMKKQY